MAATSDLKFDPEKFWKEQDFQTSARLHLQHWIWSYQLGYHVHPKIPVHGDHKLKIADVACGNGAWLLDLSNTAPQHEYHGFDITAAHFPSAAWLPSNLRLDVWDAFSDVPDHYLNTFDVVHIRTIYSAVVDNKVQPLLINLLKMLKPGGYIQWDEQDASTQKANAPEGVSSEALTTIVNLLAFMSRHQTKLFPDWLHNLPSTLQAHGCEVLAEEVVQPRPELSRAWSDNMLTNWMSVIPRIPETATPLPPVPGLPTELSRKSFADLVMRAADEATRGVWPSMIQRVVVARKAA